MSAAEYLFVTPEPLYTTSGRLFARGASTRLGSLLPMQGLRSLGYDARAVSTYGGSADAEAEIRQAQCVVFGEMFATPQGWPVDTYRQMLAAVRESTQRAVFYLADDHFDDAQFSGFYGEAFKCCRAVATVSENLAAAIRRFTDKPVFVAPEPCEGPRHAPRAIQAPRSLPVIDRLARWAGVSREPWRVHLLWFGNWFNFRPLRELLPQLEKLSAELPLSLDCITQPVEEVIGALGSTALRTRFVPWSLEALDSALLACDLVLIPVELGNPRKLAKSPNRLTQALHGGRFVVAHPLPAYQPYAEFTHLGADLCEGIRWAIRHPAEVLQRIRRGQAYLDRHHSLEVVARFWLDVFHPRQEQR